MGMKSVPRGGLGNRLLNHFNLSNIASQLGSTFFSANWHDTRYLKRIFQPRVVPFGPSGTVTFGREDVERDGFIDIARSAIEERKTIILRPHLLLSSYAWTVVGSAEKTYTTLARMCSAHRSTAGEGSIVLHMRAGDYHQWNPKAILSSEFYIDALQILGPELDEGASVRICKDDLSHPAFEVVSAYIRSRGWRLENQECNSPLRCDFRAMIDATFLICSPSTLCLSAAIIGNARTIHNTSWLEGGFESQEYFWSKLEKKEIPSIAVKAFI